MKFAICNELFQEIDFDKVCRKVKKYGYAGVEIAPYTFAKDVRHITPKQRKEIVATGRKYQLEIPAIHWLLTTPEGMSITTPNQDRYNFTFNYFKALVDFANDIHAGVLVLGSPQQRNIKEEWDRGESEERAINLLREVGYHIQDIESDVIIAFEPLSPEVTNFGASISAGLDLIERINHTHVKLHIDANAMTTEKDGPNCLIEKIPKEMIAHVHINEPNRLGPGMETDSSICGIIIQKLHEMGYSRWVSVETFDRNISGDEIAEKSMQYIENELKTLKK